MVYWKAFEITGGVEGEGVEEGCVIFICVQEEGKEFRVKPKGSNENRKKWFDDIDDIIGKKIIVRFKGRSEDHIPIFSEGILIQDYE